MNIEIRFDRKRGCGWRKPGGLYLISGGLAAPCGKLPIPLIVCPTCHHGIKPSRGWTWINGTELLKDTRCRYENSPHCMTCSLHENQPGQVGLIWIGEKFYSYPSDFIKEADHQGISRRISAIPNDFKLGETWIWLAHRKAISKLCDHSQAVHEEKCKECNDDGFIYTPGIFRIFRPQAIEYVVKSTESDEELARLEKRGITLVKIEKMGETKELISK